MKWNFNKSQLKAINHIEGACAVIAGAGSGKSTVLVNRIKNMVENGIDPCDIMATSFTVNSANDLIKKLTSLDIPVKTNSTDGVTVGTFNSICYRYLKSISGNKFRLYSDSTDTYKYLKKIGYTYKNKAIAIDDVLSFISYQQCYGASFNDEFVAKESDYDVDTLRRFYEQYEEYKRENMILDQNDLLLKTISHLQNNKNELCKYILVDEHQDSNLLQYRLIDLFCPSGNVYCVFDYRQAIYGFRGSSPEYCLDFKKHYPNAELINMVDNYRSDSKIVDISNKFIRKYYGTLDSYSDSASNSMCDGAVEIETSYTREEEAIRITEKVEKLLEEGVKHSDIAIICRNRMSLTSIQGEFVLKNIPFATDEMNDFFERKEVKTIMCLLRLIADEDDDEAFEQVFKVRIKGFQGLGNDAITKAREIAGKLNISLLKAIEYIDVPKPYMKNMIIRFSNNVKTLRMSSMKGMPLMSLMDGIINTFDLIGWLEYNHDGSDLEKRIEAIDSLKKFVKNNDIYGLLKYVYGKRSYQKKEKSNSVELMTIHKSKGLEFKYVFVVGVEDGKFPDNRSTIQDEARLFYVAMTRAINGLYVSQIGNGNLFVDELIN